LEVEEEDEEEAAAAANAVISSSFTTIPSIFFKWKLSLCAASV